MEILAKNAGAVVLAAAILYAANQHNETQRCVAFYDSAGGGGLAVWSEAKITTSAGRKISLAAKRIGCRDGWIERLEGK